MIHIYISNYRSNWNKKCLSKKPCFNFFTFFFKFKYVWHGPIGEMLLKFCNPLIVKLAFIHFLCWSQVLYMQYNYYAQVLMLLFFISDPMSLFCVSSPYNWRNELRQKTSWVEVKCVRPASPHLEIWIIFSKEINF